MLEPGSPAAEYRMARDKLIAIWRWGPGRGPENTNAYGHTTVCMYAVHSTAYFPPYGRLFLDASCVWTIIGA